MAALLKRLVLELAAFLSIYMSKYLWSPWCQLTAAHFPLNSLHHYAIVPDTIDRLFRELISINVTWY